MNAPFHTDRRPKSPPHIAIVPSGYAYAARAANRAMEVRLAREANIAAVARAFGSQMKEQGI